MISSIFNFHLFDADTNQFINCATFMTLNQPVERQKLNMGNSIQQYRCSIGRFQSKICSSSWDPRSSTKAKSKSERNIEMILHVLTVAIIKAEAWEIISSVISVFQTIMFVGTYSIFLVNACKSLSECIELQQERTQIQMMPKQSLLNFQNIGKF